MNKPWQHTHQQLSPYLAKFFLLEYYVTTRFLYKLIRFAHSQFMGLKSLIFKIPNNMPQQPNEMPLIKEKEINYVGAAIRKLDRYSCQKFERNLDSLPIWQKSSHWNTM